jgi:hypothetical protein
MHIIVARLSAWGVVRDVVVYPVAEFVWTLEQVDPRPGGTAVRIPLPVSDLRAIRANLAAALEAAWAAKVTLEMCGCD